MKKKKKWKDVRNALIMVLVMVAMMSSATYAWFSMSNNPTVTGMEMVATSTSGLTVGKEIDGKFYNAISLDLASELANAGDPDNMNEPSSAVDGDLLKLTPVSMQQPTGFVECAYNEAGEVTGLNQTAVTTLEGCVAVYTYYIKSDNGTVDVGILTGDITQSNQKFTVTNNMADSDGTMVRQKTKEDGSGAGNASEIAAYAIRMGLVVGDNAADFANMIVLEPNNDGVLDDTNLTGAPYSGATSETTKTNIAPKVSFTKTGVISTGAGATEKASAGLFECGETPTKVTMYIWLEGADPQCVDEIKSDQLEAQIQFAVVGDNTP